MNTLDCLFTWFIVATIRGTLLALAVLALQAALRGRISARWRYALWMPVVVVLAASWLPQSRWSLENYLRPKATEVMPRSRGDAAYEGTPQSQTLPASSTDSSPAGGADWWWLGAQVAWLGGAVAVLSFALAAYARTMRRMRRGAVPTGVVLRAMLSEAAIALDVHRVPQLLVSTAVQSPAVCGFFRPILLLPADFPDAFTREEAGLVLRHELMHCKRHDLPLNWLLWMLQAIHWCNPLLGFVFARMRADREAACDQQVLAVTSEDCRADYGHALIKLEGRLANCRLNLGFIGLFERGAGMRARLRAISGYRRTHPGWGVIAAALIVVLTLAGATRAQNPPAKAIADAPAPNADLLRKLNTIIIPRLEFREASVRHALAYLQKRSVELDPAKVGVKIVLEPVSLTNISLGEAFRHVARLANLRFEVEPYYVALVPIREVKKSRSGMPVQPPDAAKPR